MATATTARAELVDDTTPDDVITLSNVEWETYCKLRDEPSNDRIRMSYLDGELTLVSPEYVHDEDAELFGLLIRGVTSGLGLTIKGIRTTTLRRGIERLKGGGKEPD